RSSICCSARPPLRTRRPSQIILGRRDEIVGVQTVELNRDLDARLRRRKCFVGALDRCMVFRLPFESAIDGELVSELEKGAAYASARLRSFRISADRREAEIECDDGAEAEVSEKVRRLVSSMVRTFRSVGEPEELVKTARRDDGPLIADAFAE